jgi:glutaredoxin
VQVRVFGRPDRVCHKCRATKAWLKRHGIEFQFINVDEDPEGDQFVRGLGALEVPVVVVNPPEKDGEIEWWSGHRIPRLEALAGRLRGE